jgi:hypothetical protein
MSIGKAGHGVLRDDGLVFMLKPSQVCCKAVASFVQDIHIPCSRARIARAFASFFRSGSG